MKYIQNDDSGSFFYKNKTETKSGFTFLVGSDIHLRRDIRKEAGGIIHIGIGFLPNGTNIYRKISITDHIVFNIGIGYAF